RAQPSKQWKMYLTTSDLLKDRMCTKRVKDIHNTELVFKNDNRPAARSLYFHFVVTQLGNKHYKCPEREKALETLFVHKPFAAPGRYRLESILLTLTSRAHNLLVEGERALCNSELTFDDMGRLQSEEEDEVAQRLIDTNSKVGDKKVRAGLIDEIELAEDEGQE
ncbi:MAG: hypothetical protein Q9164_005855, partial [Protoblastenia rupestris]